MCLKKKRAVQCLIKRLKYEWFSNKAAEFESSVKRNWLAWKDIRDLWRARKGLRPTITRVVKKESGDMCITPRECHADWKRHL